MRAKSKSTKRPAEQVVKEIRRATRRHFSAEDKMYPYAGGRLAALRCDCESALVRSPYEHT